VITAVLRSERVVGVLRTADKVSSCQLMLHEGTWRMQRQSWGVNAAACLRHQSSDHSCGSMRSQCRCTWRHLSPVPKAMQSLFRHPLLGLADGHRTCKLTSLTEVTSQACQGPVG